MASPVITATGLVKRYGSNTVLDGASFEIGEGVTGLLGSNGAGKTTLLGLVLGLSRPDEGSMTVLGSDPRVSGPEIRARIGYSPEHHLLPPDLPAVDFVRHIAEIHGLSRDDAVGRASDALWFVGLGEERLRPLGTLSTGQRQRAKLAMAIAHDPDLVLLDEPTDGLDPSQRDTMLELIARLASDFGLSVVLSSHLLDEVERTCDSVVILNEGRIAASGSIEALRGEDRGVTVEVDTGVEQLVPVLAAWGIDVAVDGDTVVLGIGEHQEGWTQDHLLWVTREAVADLGLPLRRLVSRRATLEDVFLAVGS